MQITPDLAFAMVQLCASSLGLCCCDRCVVVLLQMLLGLNYMHDRKILHRDFKTMNVFLDDKLNVRLGDLGVAKVSCG